MGEKTNNCAKLKTVFNKLQSFLIVTQLPSIATTNLLLLFIFDE